MSKEKTKNENTEKEEKEKPSRVRWFMMILYPDNMHHMDILAYLRGEKEYKFPYQACYILHEPDKECGKPHYHVILHYPSPRTAQGVADSFGKGTFRKMPDGQLVAIADSDREGIDPSDILEGQPLIVPRKGKDLNTLSPVSDIHSIAMYILHQTYECIREGKKQYAFKDIKACNHDFEFIKSMYDIDKLEESGSPVWQIMDYMEQNKLNNMRQLMRFLFLNNETQLIRYVEKHTYLIKQLF